jgi:hypothetical protein
MSRAPLSRTRTACGVLTLSCAPAWELTGEGDTLDTAVADLREALGLVAEFGAPGELTLMVDMAGCLR